jgi:hypothetical protein
VGRTLLSAALDLDFDLRLSPVAGTRTLKSKSKSGSRSKSADKSVRPTRDDLRQVEQQDLGVAGTFHHKLLLVADGGAVALVEALSIQLDRAPGYLQPGVSAITELMLHFLFRFEQGNVKLGILMDGD